MRDGGPLCRECRALIQSPGRIYDQGASTTLMAWTPYWDATGYHSHNPNRTTQTYLCDRGHRWSQVLPTSCPNPECDWRSGTP